jgi:hypothetical protein
MTQRREAQRAGEAAVERLHSLGPAPLGLIREIEASADINARLEIYARLPADFIRALGGDQFAPAIHIIEDHP